MNLGSEVTVWYCDGKHDSAFVKILELYATKEDFYCKQYFKK